MNFVDCSNAPNCAKLNRNLCFKTAGTCGSCLSGFLGNDYLPVHLPILCVELY